MIFDFGDALQLREATRADYDDVFSKFSSSQKARLIYDGVL